MSAAVVLAVLLAVWYGLLKARWVPVLGMRAWFLFVNVITIFPLSALTWLVDVVLQCVRAPKHWTESLCVVVLTVAFRLVRWLNPQIRVHVSYGLHPDGRRLHLGDVSRRTMIVGNHTSFWDVYVALSLIPLGTLLYTRTFMKAALRRIPVFGPTFDRVGQFPVYFTSDEEGNFHVDKVKQAKVQADVVAHVRRGGNLALFPEGQLNRHPATLQPFRYGAFATVLENRMHLLYAVVVGNDTVWPMRTAMGGYPGDCYAYVGYYRVEDGGQQDAQQLAEGVRARMQVVCTNMIADIKDGRPPQVDDE